MALDLTISSLDHSSRATPAPTKKSPIGSILGSHPKPWSLTQSHKSPPPHTQSPPPVSSVSSDIYLTSLTSPLTAHCGRPAAIVVTTAITATSVTTPTLCVVHLPAVKSCLLTTTMGLVGAAIGT